jgi:hypothetical protein
VWRCTTGWIATAAAVGCCVSVAAMIVAGVVAARGSLWTPEEELETESDDPPRPDR